MAIIKCPECGREISDKAAACPGCGCPVEHAGAAHAAPAPTLSEEALLDSEEVKNFINGSVYRSYVEKFKRNISFNWAAYFFGWLWFIYRKMYCAGFLVLLAELLLTVFVLCIGIGIYGLDSLNEGSELSKNLESTTSILGYVLGFLFQIGVGFFANSLYKKSLIKRCEKARVLAGPEREIFVRKYSGTNPNALVLIYVLLFLPVVGILIYASFNFTQKATSQEEISSIYLDEKDQEEMMKAFSDASYMNVNPSAVPAPPAGSAVPNGMEAQDKKSSDKKTSANRKKAKKSAVPAEADHKTTIYLDEEDIEEMKKAFSSGSYMDSDLNLTQKAETQEERDSVYLSEEDKRIMIEAFKDGSAYY